MYWHLFTTTIAAVALYATVGPRDTALAALFALSVASIAYGIYQAIFTPYIASPLQEPIAVTGPPADAKPIGGQIPLPPPCILNRWKMNGEVHIWANLGQGAREYYSTDAHYPVWHYADGTGDLATGKEQDAINEIDEVER